MPSYRIGEAARLLGVSDDTMRRWAEAGRLATARPAGGPRVVDGEALAAFARGLSAERPSEPIVRQSARNRFRGLVTRVERDGVMALVEIQSGPHRVVSLMSREAADELGLQIGVLAVASVKATAVVVELPTRDDAAPDVPVRVDP